MSDRSVASEARELARGRWRGLLPAMKVSAVYLTGKHTGCPMCGGMDRFRFDDREGTGSWFCSHCGSGDGYQLAERVAGIPFREVVRRVKDMVELIPPDQRAKRETTPEALKRLLTGVWQSASPLMPNDLAWAYLESRSLKPPFPPSKVLRFHPGLRDEHAVYPGLVARVMPPDAGAKFGGTVHRTFLDPKGGKAPIPAPRKLMKGPFPKGAAIRLAEIAPDGTLGVAEGIETALSCHALFGIPTWSVVNAGNMAVWVWPETVTRLVVFGDADPGHTGQMAAHALAKQAHAKGITVEVRIPDQIGQDWNDVLQARP